MRAGCRRSLAAVVSGRSAQQPLGADVFVDFWPVDTVAASGNLPVAALLGGSVEQPRVPCERDGDGAAVLQANAQRVPIKRYVRNSLICRYCQNTLSKRPQFAANDFSAFDQDRSPFFRIWAGSKHSPKGVTIVAQHVSAGSARENQLSPAGTAHEPYLHLNLV